MAKKAQIVVAVVGLLAAALPTFAHHSFSAEFDSSKTVTIEGTISKIMWINPHVYVYVDSKDQSGNVTTWAFETLPTGFLHKMGITKDLLQGNPGDKVTVTANPAKDGTKALGWIMTVTYPDGHHYMLTGEPSKGN